MVRPILLLNKPQQAINQLIKVDNGQQNSTPKTTATDNYAKDGGPGEF